MKSQDQINFFHYKSVLSSFRSVPVLAKKQLFSCSNEYPTFCLYIVFALPQPLLQSCDTWISSTSSGVSLLFQAFLSAAYLLFTYLLLFPSLLLLPVQTLLKLLFLHLFHVTLPWIFIPWQCCRMHCPCWLFCPVSTASPNYFLQLNSPAISAPALWPSDLFCFSDSLFSTAKQE